MKMKTITTKWAMLIALVTAFSCTETETGIEPEPGGGDGQFSFSFVLKVLFPVIHSYFII